MSCIFCDIIKGKAKRSDDYTRYNDGTVSFSPRNPVTPGHTLVIALVHTKDFTEDPDIAGKVTARASRIAKGRGGQWNLITSAGPDATQTVWHYHVHLVPRSYGDRLKLPWTGQKKG